MLVEKIETFEAFQLTSTNSKNNVDWPNWMHEAWNREPHEQYFVGRRDQFYADAKPEELVLRIADMLVPVHIGDVILRDQHGHLELRSERVFLKDYRIVHIERPSAELVEHKMLCRQISNCELQISSKVYATHYSIISVDGEDIVIYARK